jgi:serine/threonine protein phosphatase PrpC
LIADNAEKNTSGSCALICLLVDKKVYVAHVGDSRAVLSMKEGREVRALTIDHKPLEEKERIKESGGHI